MTLRSGSTVIACALAFVAAGCAEVEARPPNVLFVLTDDLRWDALGAYGNESIRTPRLDALAEQGARLDALYVASPICSPSRASFLSGLYPHQEGVAFRRGRWELERATPSVATFLASAGYATGFVGKAHLGGDPRRWGFDEVPVTLPGRRIGQRSDGRQKLVTADGVEWIEGHAPERLVDAAIAFIEAHRDERWLLWLATSSPHHPYSQDAAFPHAASEIEPPPGWPAGQPFDPGRWADYYSLVGRMDHQLGRLFDALDGMGLARSTFVFVTSDNGIQHGSHGVEGKAVWYEESTRVPGLVRWPGRVEAGATIAAPIASVDLLPTLLDLVGLEAPPHLEGASFLPALAGEPGLRRRVFSEVRPRGRAQPDAGAPRSGGVGSWQMVRDDRFKLVDRGDGEILYDLESDPGESRNLIDSPEHEPVRRTLRSRLEAWRRETGPG